MGQFLVGILVGIVIGSLITLFLWTQSEKNK